MVGNGSCGEQLRKHLLDAFLAGRLDLDVDVGVGLLEGSDELVPPVLGEVGRHVDEHAELNGLFGGLAGVAGGLGGAGAARQCQGADREGGPHGGDTTCDHLRSSRVVMRQGRYRWSDRTIIDNRSQVLHEEF